MDMMGVFVCYNKVSCIKCELLKYSDNIVENERAFRYY